MTFRPLHDRVVVRRIEAEEKTAGGIIIPDTAKEKPQEGEVIAVGTGIAAAQIERAARAVGVPVLVGAVLRNPDGRIANLTVAGSTRLRFDVHGELEGGDVRAHTAGEDTVVKQMWRSVALLLLFALLRHLTQQLGIISLLDRQDGLLGE